MKYDYGATWAEQSIHLSFDWEFYTSPTLRVETSGQQWPRSILDVAVGDEHDDPDVTYTFTSLGAWINVQLQFEIINEFGSSPVFEAKLWMFEPEGNQVSSRTGRKLSDNTTFTMTQTGTLEVTIEQLAASTRVAGKINGEDIGWTTTFPAREQWASHGAKLFRESPHFRVGAFGRQTYGPASLNPHNGLAEDGFKIDRLRASAVAL